MLVQENTMKDSFAENWSMHIPFPASLPLQKNRGRINYRKMKIISIPIFST